MALDPFRTRMSTIQESSSENLTGKTSPYTASTTTLPDERQYLEFSDILRTDSIMTNRKNTPWTSIIITAGLGFCSAIQFSLYFASTWPFLQILDPNVTEQFYGLVIASYSLGQIIGAPLLGYWSNRIENVQIPVTACLLLSLTGNFIYVASQMFPENSIYLVILARFIVGVGAGNISILKSYASMASSSEDRSRAIALVTGGIAVGSMCGPAIQLIFTPIGYPGFQITENLLLNVYTLPAVAACVMNLVGMCFLWLLFKEKYAGLIDVDKTKSETEEKKLPKYDLIAILVVHVTLFAQRFTFANIETLSGPIGQSIFAWTKADIVFYIGLAHSIVSMIALSVDFIFVAFKMDKILNFRLHCVCAVIGLMLFHLFTFDWPFLPSDLKTYTQQEYDLAASLNGTELTGCNVDRFSWCKEIKQLNVWVYYASYVLFIGVCFPSINITLNTLFSKILGPRRIAAAQGLLQMTGSFARLAGPLIVSNVYAKFGPRLSWIIELIVLSIVIVFWLKFYNRMQPLNWDKNKTSIKSKITLASPTIKPVEMGDSNQTTADKQILYFRVS